MKLIYQTFIGRALSLAILLFLVFYIVNNFSLLFQRDSFQPVPVTNTVSSSSLSVGIPVRLYIPSIAVDASIQQVGKTFKGNMGVPYTFSDTGWYKYGAKPGEQGNAVIDGHVDNGWGLAAVFYELKKLKTGDKIYVIDDKGATSTFQVMETEEYAYKNAPLEKIFGATSEHALNLITCAGTWISSEKTNDKRLVIYSKQVLQ